MRGKRLVLMVTVLAATLTARANDTPLLIELNLRDRALPLSVSASGAVVVGNLDGPGGFYWMPTTAVIFTGGDVTRAVSRDGRTIIGTARDAQRLTQAAIWLRAAEWKFLGSLTSTPVWTISVRA